MLLKAWFARRYLLIKIYCNDVVLYKDGTIHLQYLIRPDFEPQILLQNNKIMQEILSLFESDNDKYHKKFNWILIKMGKAIIGHSHVVKAGALSHWTPTTRYDCSPLMLT